MFLRVSEAGPVQFLGPMTVEEVAEEMRDVGLNALPEWKEKTPGSCCN